MTTVLGLALSLSIGVSLGFFGGGGSILTVPLLVYVFGLEPKQAIASSLLVVGVSSVSGAYQHWRAGNVELRTALQFGAGSMAGAYLGARAGAYVDGALLLLLFAAMMVLTSLAMWRGRRAPSGMGAPRRAIGRLVAQGFGVGLFTGLVGAGGGFLIVPALALFAGLPMATAVGTSLAVIVMSTIVGYSGYASHVAVDPALVGSVSLCAVLGSFAGSRLADRIDPGTLRRSFAVFVLAIAAFIFARETDAWLAAARQAVPQSAPQLVFVLAVLGFGIAAGRVSRRGGADPLGESAFVEGAGI